MVTQQITAPGADNLSQREYILIGPQPQFGIEAPWYVTTPVIPNSGSYSGGFLQLLDEGRRGVNAADFDAQEGVGEGTITLEANIRLADTDEDQMAAIGYLMANLIEVGSAANANYIMGEETIGDNDANQEVTQSDSIKVHNLTAGTRKQYLTVKQGVTDVYEHTYRDCKCTNMTLSFVVGEGFATFSATLMGQNRIVEATKKNVSQIFSPSGIQVAGWHAKGEIPKNQEDGTKVQGTATLKATANADLSQDFPSQIQSMDWSIDREAQRFYGADANQEMNDIFLGPLRATIALSVIFRRSEDIELYTRKVKGLVTSDCIAQYQGKQLPNDTPNRAFRIGSRVTDFADELINVNLSDIHAMLPFAARALYTSKAGPFHTGVPSGGTITNGQFDGAQPKTAVLADDDATAANGGQPQNGPFQVQLIQHQAEDNDFRFTDLVPPHSRVSAVTDTVTPTASYTNSGTYTDAADDDLLYRQDDGSFDANSSDRDAKTAGHFYYQTGKPDGNVTIGAAGATKMTTRLMGEGAAQSKPVDLGAVTPHARLWTRVRIIPTVAANAEYIIDIPPTN